MAFILPTLVFCYFSFYEFNRLTICNYLTVAHDGDVERHLIKYIYLYINWKKNERRLDVWNLKPIAPDCISETLHQLFQNVSIPSFGEDCCAFSVDAAEDNGVRRVDWLPTNFDEGVSYELQNFMAAYPEMIDFGIENLKLELRFRTELVDETRTVFRTIAAQYREVISPTFVCMHHKSAVIEDNLTSSIYIEPATYMFYSLAMGYFKTKYGNVIFILIAEDSRWLEENERRIASSGPTVPNPLKTGDLKRNFVLLSNCNRSVINVGAYSTISALFAGGETVVYANERRRSDKLPYGDSITVAQNMHPPKWLVGDNRKLGRFADFY